MRPASLLLKEGDEWEKNCPGLNIGHTLFVSLKEEGIFTQITGTRVFSMETCGQTMGGFRTEPVAYSRSPTWMALTGEDGRGWSGTNWAGTAASHTARSPGTSVFP